MYITPAERKSSCSAKSEANRHSGNAAKGPSNASGESIVTYAKRVRFNKETAPEDSVR